MKKSAAIKLLGGQGVGAKTRAAERLGITPSAVTQWPDQLPDTVAHRVIAELALPYMPLQMRRELGIKRNGRG